MDLMGRVTAELKTAMLARDTFATDVLRGLKSAIQYEAVAQNKRDEGLSDDEVEKVVAREAKKRNDAIELYVSAGDKARAEKEEAETKILLKFLPEQLDVDEIKTIAERVITAGGYDKKMMGRAIGEVKAEVGTRADGAVIARIVKERLQ
jgi:uncharacterized protein YqeY